MTEDNDIAKTLSESSLKEKKDAWDKKARELGLKPGQLVPGTQSWVPWIKEDLDPSDTVTFVCQDVLGTQGGVIYDEKGKGFILDVNGLTCWLRVNDLNTVNRFFYSRYEAMVNDNIRLEDFKRNGPRDSMPWGAEGWHYIPFAMSFGLDIDGRMLRDPKWYEFDQDGVPIKINNVKKLATLYLDGDIDFKITNAQFVGLIFSVTKIKLVNKIKKILRRK